MSIAKLWQKAALHGISYKAVVQTSHKLGAPIPEVEAWLQFLDETGWVLSRGDAINGRNFRRSLRMWHIRETEMRNERALKSADKSALAKAAEQERLKAAASKAANDSGAWVLCNERCAKASGCGCTCGFRVPPSAWTRPIPPEECPKFLPKGGAR